MDSLSHNDNFSKRVRSLRELQLNFTLHADNEVLICANDPGSFQTSLQAEGE